jgi:hypothetical protein
MSAEPTKQQKAAIQFVELFHDFRFLFHEFK